MIGRQCQSRRVFWWLLISVTHTVTSDCESRIPGQGGSVGWNGFLQDFHNRGAKEKPCLLWSNQCAFLNVFKASHPLQRQADEKCLCEKTPKKLDTRKRRKKTGSRKLTVGVSVCVWVWVGGCEETE